MRWILCMLIVMALAGCSKSAPAAEPLAETPVIASTGIAGVVVDATITPIRDVTVTMGTSTVTTDTGGRFAFPNASDGTHIIRAVKNGFLDAEVTVQTGAPDATNLKLVLERDLTGIAYAVAYHVQGHVACGLNFAAVCGTMSLAGVGEDSYAILHDTGPDIWHLQTELVWEPGQDLAERMTMWHRFATQETYDSGFYDGEITGNKGESPFLMVTNTAYYNQMRVGEDYKFLTSVYVADPEDLPVGVMIGQDYELFIHEFHGYFPPVGWRFTDNDGVPTP